MLGLSAGQQPPGAKAPLPQGAGAELPEIKSADVGQSRKR